MNYKIEDMLSRLVEMRTLKNGWDGYYAPPIDRQAISSTEKLLRYLPVVPFICPTGRATVQIEYEKPDNDYIEFEIYPNKIAVFHVRQDNTHEKYIYDDCSTDTYMKVADDVKMFFNQKE